MKAAVLMGLMAGVLFSAQAYAGEYVFNCQNEWQQSRLITMSAPSIAEARKILKTDREMMDKYGLSRTSLCVFRSELPAKKSSKSAVKPKQDESPTE